MQFSTSATLAAVALFAGQTFAICTDGPLTGSGGGLRLPCSQKDPKVKHWVCDNAGTSIVDLPEAGWLLHSGTQNSIVQVTCGDDVRTLTCSPNSWGGFQLDCPDAKVWTVILEDSY
ncbi:hypothetical protein E4U55_004227 [Claviceps digitariae]|nr:hypothetical protein E4U55_004227 [Claviceps digitariae]